MTQTEELFLQALRAFFRQEKVLWDALPESGAPDSVPTEDAVGGVFRLSGEQHVFPMVFEASYASPAVSASSAFPALRRRAMGCAAEEVEKTAFFLGLYRKMREKGLSPLAVKGILCRSVYPSGHLRVSADEDLLIRDGEYDAAVAVLTGCGMTPTDPDSVVKTDSCWVCGSCRVELHRALFPTENAATEKLNAVFGDPFADAETYSVEGGAEVLSLSPEKHLLYLLLHAFKHFIHSGFGIRQVCDVGLWADRYTDGIDLHALYLACERTNALLFAKSVFLIARDVTGRAIPLSDEWEAVAADPSPMLSDLLSGGVFGSNDLSRLHSAGITLNAAGASAAKKRPSGVLSSLFPPKSQLEAQYPELKQKPCLLPVVWCKRIFRYAKETRAGDSDAVKTLSIAKERVALLRFYGIVK
ncbi:MAG: nucleotidyltransferase family protein [Lachnospiraceae bacterium]|nr:nucleotidyltransferase family protein [Lachnospiraceae bacterium]